MNLYHYTSVENMTRIVESGKLFLTCAFFMNDKTEFIHAMDMTKSIVKGMIEENHSHWKLLERTLNYLEAFNGSYANIFVFSFTTRSNLLSQWRGYTQINKGVSLGFDADKLVERGSSNGFTLHKCLYSPKDHLSEIKTALNLFLGGFSSGNLDAYVGENIAKLLITMATIKSHKFEEENEYRLISKYQHSYEPEDIKFRPGEKILIPYMELGIESLNDDGTMFKNVVIGPSDNPNLQIMAVANYLRSKNACNGVGVSEIPLR